MNSVILEATAARGGSALVLRPWGPDDLAALVGLPRDPALVRWTSSWPDSPAAWMRWLDVQQQAWAAGHRFAFAVLESSLQVVGNVVVKDLAADTPAAAVGYWTLPHARGRGIASRALETLTSWAFDTFRLERLELLHQVDNVASCRVAEKTGYTFDKTLPAMPPAYPLDGHLHVRCE
ncbi:RimJ/RimL family protein N-acetyltransferase [Tenggerimyces flavus]|nr:GNAT family N-acetyltransferase [Tenggerimyces flavus]MBM7783747.1 RimJ/RimL family protein N-acetyltransferase [Tenggerimyces flavus]